MKNKKWINARFGDKWTEHALEHYSVNTICGIAISNGRKAIILEAALKLILEKFPTSDIEEIIKEALDEK